MAANRAPLREEDIRERVNLEYQNLADVRSLSLPGTYHEKIIHLGNSLKNFIRLKSLDLSRNALTTLEGLQHLAYLEKLNLYFNRISALSEVFRLHSLTALKDVDLRLNPVVKNESDYRLFVVHMLPNLRRLDDRPVRDSERKASLLHFTTDHAYELKKSSFVAKAAEPGSSSHPRVAYISSMSKKCIVMDDDDEAVLNLIANCEWDLRNSPGVTGSTQRNPSGASSANRYMLLKVPVTSKECGSLLKSPTLLTIHHGFGKRQEKRKNNVKVKFVEEHSQELPKRDPNLMFHDETEAYEKIMAHANITPHPEMNEAVVYSEKKTRCNQKEPEEHGQNSKGEPQEATQLASEVLYEATPLERLLDLVDKYWNGSKSLHRNRKFLSQAEMILSAIQESMPTEQQKASSSHPELDNLLLEKKALEKCLSVQEKQFTAKIKDMESELNSTKNYMDVFKQRLDQVLEENTVLKACTSKQEQNDQNTANLAQLQIVELQNLNKLLTTENASLQQRLQHFDKMQDLTVMLQESHRTLVSTNQRLLQELDETRARQKAEVEQLHWNYDQLKKSMSKLSFSDMNDSRS
ncbi:centrosomal protein of 72 kDa isoform X2 [Tiliqua scincoides]|uniref:centrosomal protein of 72 kDa isoform X2 n=1 Tax=Tiliqua scincoides TaxID=71010 RepID=UPI0034617CE2